MKMRKMLILAGICLVIVLLLVLGTGIAGKMVRNPKSDEPPGTLVKVIYHRVRVVILGEDFYIELSPEEVICANYWPRDDSVEFQLTTVEHLALSEEQWKEVEAAMLDLYPVMEPRSGEASSPFLQLVKKLLQKGMPVQDGGDRDDLTLIWETEEGQRTVQYYWPSDSRVLTLTELLRGLVEGGEEH